MDQRHRQDADATWHWHPANEPKKSKNWYQTGRNLALALVALTLSACGYNYRLPGHGPDTTAAVTMKVGQTRHALSERIIPIKFGYQLSLSSEDPGIVDVKFRGDPRRKANIWLVAKAPGKAVIHYGNVFNQTFPFGKFESERLGVSLPFMEPEEPGAGKGWPRKTWLRKYSDGAFVVEVRP